MKKESLVSRVFKAKMAYLFIAPLILGLAMFSYYPAFSGIFHSFFDWDSMGDATFIGINNFKELFKDKVFLDSCLVMLKISLPKLIIGVVVPLVVAEIIFNIKSTKAKGGYRVLILLPMVTPGVVGILIWKFMYDPNNGLMTELTRLFGIINPATVIDWLGDPKMVIFSVIFMGFPWIGGTAVLIYMSGLMNISKEVIESSVLDGCGTFRRILAIDIPTIMGQIRYFLIMGIIGGLQDFSLQIMLTHGGPGYTTTVPGYYMYTQAFYAGRMGYASAIGTVMFVTIFIFTAFTYKYMKTSEESK